MPEPRVYTAKKIFTGETWLQDHSLIVTDDVITDILPATQPADCEMIIPAFIDLQLYGAYGKLFSVYPSAETLHLIHQYCREGGAYWFQPTVATNTPEIFRQAIDGVRAYWQQGGAGCLGLHVEGPWISREKRGAHIAALVQTPTAADVRALLEYGQGVISMVTVAPEVCSDEVIELFHQYDVVLSAGHSSATYQQATRSFSRGIHAVTHLFNAMSALQHREPGLVGAAMLHDQVRASVIADGHHVSFEAINIARQVMRDRLFLITDAVTDTTEGAYPHQLAGDKYEASGILSGSALNMMQSVKNMIRFCGASLEDALKMATSTPAKVAGREDNIGRLVKGAQARLILADDSLEQYRLL